MIRESVEVRDGRGTVRAVQVTDARYPGSEVRVVFPIEPEAFFAEDVAHAAERFRILASAAR